MSTREDINVKHKYAGSLLRVLEIAVLFAVITVICGLYMLPTLFYVRPPIDQVSISTTNATNVTIRIHQHVNNFTTSFYDELACSDGFYFNGNICKPECGIWSNPNSMTDTTLGRAVAIVTPVIGLVFSLLYLLISVTVLRKLTWKFPAIYLVYMSMSIALLSLIILIAIAGQDTVFCSSRDLLESFDSPAPFCTLNGFVFYYCALQVSTLCLFYSGALLWSIMFPFQYRRYEKENKLKYVHITTALLALLLPLVSSFVILAFGYARSYNHESICPGRNSDSIYAGVTLPMSIMGAVSSSILVVVFWAIFKLLVIKKSKFTKEKNQGRQKAGTAEFKVLLVLGYTSAFQVLFLINLSIVRSKRESTEIAFQEYFLCESVPQQECDPPTVDASSDVRILRGFVAVLQALIPIIIFLISLNIILKLIKKYFHKLFYKNSTHMESA